MISPSAHKTRMSVKFWTRCKATKTIHDSARSLILLMHGLLYMISKTLEVQLKCQNNQPTLMVLKIHTKAQKTLKTQKWSRTHTTTSRDQSPSFWESSCLEKMQNHRCWPSQVPWSQSLLPRFLPPICPFQSINNILLY